MPFQSHFWNIPSWAIALMYMVLGLSALALAAQFWQRVQLWQLGRGAPRLDYVPWRLARLAKYALAQVRIASSSYAGLMHLSMSWAVIVLCAAFVLSGVDASLFKISSADLQRMHCLALDVGGLFLGLGLVLAMLRRRFKPGRLTFSARFNGGLALLLGIVCTGFLSRGVYLAAQQPDWAAWAPVSNVLGRVIVAAGLADVVQRYYVALWLAHMGLLALLLLTLPQHTLYLHLLTAPLNIFFSDPQRPRGALLPLEDAEASKLQEFDWTALLAADACVECGRCQEACPAYLAGRPLDPKQLILDIRALMRARGPELAVPLVPDVLRERPLQEQALDSCLACYACVQQCPVLINHLDVIVDLRRYLTVAQGRSHDVLRQALLHVERTGNPWGRPPGERLEWAAKYLPEEMDVPLMSERRAVDVLYWVGCAGSFDPRGQQTTLAMFEILKTAGVDFAVLGEEEFCHCEWARRAGNEHVYQSMVARNLQTLRQYDFDRILTQCSHCFNTFKNEYPQFGADFPVVHHSQFIVELILGGRLHLRRQLQGRAVWHDACYLGRYNGDYDTARHVLRATGLDLVEMPRFRDKGLCCGAGGANFWFETKPPAHGRPGARLEQVQHIRLREALDCNADTLAVACPFCALALSSAAQTTGAQRGVAIRDIAELVAELI